jgi:hypothetical protein
MSFKYIISQQEKWERKWRLQEEQEAREEEARIAKLEAEEKARKKAAYRKKRLLEQQESERLRADRLQRQKIVAEEQWENQCDVLTAQIKERFQKDKKLEEIRFIVHNHEPSLQVLDWTNWLLSDPLNQKLAILDLEMAMELFKRDNLLAKRRHGTRGGKKANVYALQFTGNDEHNQLGRNDTARADLVATQFNPNDPTNKGFSSSDRKPLAESGFTVAYWWRPDELYSDSFAIGWKRASGGRFEFGIKNASKPYFSIANSEVKNTTWADFFDNSNNSDLKNTLLDSGEGTAPGSGNNLIMNKWYHMVFTYEGTDNTTTMECGGDPDPTDFDTDICDGESDGTEVNVTLRKMYMNGKQIYGVQAEGKASVNWTSETASQMTQGLSFGMRAVKGSGTHTDGLGNVKYNNGNACALSEIAIYSEEKDAAWVSNVYNKSMDFNHKDSGGDGLVAYWKLDEGGGTTAKDSGPYGWHGTLTNAGYGTAIDGSTSNSSQIAGINARFPNATPTWTTHPIGYDQ